MGTIEAWQIILSDGSSLLLALDRRDVGCGSFILEPRVTAEIPAAATEAIRELLDGLNILRADFLLVDDDGEGTAFEQIDDQTAFGVPLGSVTVERLLKRIESGEIDLELQVEEIETEE